MKTRRIEVFGKFGTPLFEYFSDLIPRINEYIEVDGNPWEVVGVEYVVKYNVVIGVKIGVR